MNDKLTQNDIKIISEENAIFDRIMAARKISRPGNSIDHEQLSSRFQQLREEASKAKPEDLPTLFDQMNSVRAILERDQKQQNQDWSAPYFAHMKLKEDQKVKDILLGQNTFLEIQGLPIIDWRHAPISRIFFNYREGEEYEEELPARLACGEVIARRILTIEDGKLVQILTGERSYRKNSIHDEWSLVNNTLTPRLRGGAGSAKRNLGTGQSSSSNPDIAALLDPEQFAILNAESDDPLLVLGGAGCGKTTVALHRAAILNFRNPKRFKQNAMTVILPEVGITRLSQRLLDSLGLSQVKATTFDEWIDMQARKMIRSLPKKICPYTPDAVVQYKRNPAIKHAFPVIVEQNLQSVIQAADRQWPSYRHFFSTLNEPSDKPILSRLDAIENTILNHIEKSQSETAKQRIVNIRKFFKEQKREILDLNSDRIDLFANDKIINHVISRSENTLSEKILKPLLSHGLDQLQNHSLHLMADVSDQNRLETVDGKSLQDEEQTGIYRTIDAEDFAILIELFYYKTGADYSHLARHRKYSHIVIDEAQGLAELELNVIGKALEPRAAVTIAGDAAQQMDPSALFKSWSEVLSALGVKQVHPHHLTTTYRSTAEIASFAHQILGPLAPANAPKSVKSGVPVSVTALPSEGPLVALLSEALSDLVIDEPNASVAIICRSFEKAIATYKVLADLPGLRLVEDGEFSFKPGIDICSVDQVKGLEFDYVIIPDADATSYRDKPDDRRMLHVAATRAIHQLWVLSADKSSLTLPKE